MVRDVTKDEYWMQEALNEAQRAETRGEVPVGAIAVYQERVIGRGHNLRETQQDPTLHAEIIALKEAAAHLQSWRLEEVTLYVTLEPCIMCAGALVQSRIARVVYGCHDPKAGALESLYAMGSDPRLNHRFAHTAGVCEHACAQQLSAFFQAIRQRKRDERRLTTSARNRTNKT